MALRYFNNPDLARGAATLAAAFAPPSPAAAAQARYQDALANKTQQDIVIGRRKQEALDQLGTLLTGVRSRARGMSQLPPGEMGPVMPEDMAQSRAFEALSPDIASAAVVGDADATKLGQLLNLVVPATEPDRLTAHLVAGKGPLRAGDYSAFTMPGLEGQREARLGDLNARAADQQALDIATAERQNQLDIAAAERQNQLDIEAGYHDPLVLGKGQTAMITPQHAEVMGLDPGVQTMHGAGVGPGAPAPGPDFGSGVEGSAMGIIHQGMTDPAVAASPAYALAYNRLYVEPRWQRTTDASGNVYMQELPPDPVPLGVPPPAFSAPAAPQAAPGAVPAAPAPVAPDPAAAAGAEGPGAITTGPGGLRRMEIGRQPPAENISRGRELYRRAAAGDDTINEITNISEDIDPDTGEVTFSLGSGRRGYRPSPGTMTMGTTQGIVGDILNAYFMSPKGRTFVQGSMTFINSILRRDSGAAVPETEYPKYMAQFLPRPGDSDDLILLKARARQVALDALRENVALPDEQAAALALQAAQQAVGIVEPNEADAALSAVYKEQYPLPASPTE